MDANDDLPIGSVNLTLKGIRVLIVDDEDAAREVLRWVLEAEGAVVSSANSGGAALAELDRQVPDVMLVDISMPILNGFTLVEQLRRRPADRGRDVPIAALTGYISSEDREKADRLGFQAYLVKPVEPGELVKTVRLLAGAQHEPGSTTP